MTRVMTAIRDQFTYPVPADRLLSIFNPRWSPQLRGTIESLTPLTPHAVSVTIRLNRRCPAFQAGQYVAIGAEIDGVRHHRTYSITSAPSASRSRIEIAVQRVQGGLMSGHLTERAQLGDVVYVGAPAGEFTLPNPLDASAPLLFLTGGSGVTPIMSMLRELEVRARSGHTVPSVVAVHHSPDRQSTMFADELDRLSNDNRWLRVVTVHTRDTNADGADNRLNPARLESYCNDWRQRRTYVCGPASLIEFATASWESNGLLAQLHLERFNPVRPARLDDLDGAVTTLARSGMVAETRADDTILDAVERAGALVPSGCRTGVCHTCTTRIVSGCVRDVRDGRIHDAEAHVQICVAQPLTDVVLDA